VPFEVKSLFNKYLNLLLIMAFLTVQGCAMAAPAVLTYGVNKLSAPKAEPAQPAPQATELRTYPEYVTVMERINLEREKAGLEPRPIMTQEEWVCAQRAGAPQAAPAPAASASAAAVPPPSPASAPATSSASAPAPEAAVAPAPPPAAAPAVSPAPAVAPAPATPPAETSEKASEAK
jgi:hypothetical protein